MSQIKTFCVNIHQAVKPNILNDPGRDLEGFKGARDRIGIRSTAPTWLDKPRELDAMDAHWQGMECGNDVFS